MRFILIRHGQSNTNVKGLSPVTNDATGLNKKGVEQARKLSHVCKKYSVEIIFTSPEQRAVDTTQIIAKDTSKPHHIIQDLRERNWGDWEGKPWESIKTTLDTMSLKERYTFIPPNGESWQQMEKRLKNALKVLMRHKYNIIAVVTHEGALRGFMPILTESSKKSGLQYNFDNASVTIFDYDLKSFKKVVVNDTSHLNS